MAAYYNEIDPKAVATLRELIRGGHIAPGDVDERSILDVRPDDIRSYTQCHFFAGFGIWSYALRLAGWDDNRPVWTGSCPCQPFSAAGKGAGFDDERHLWPAWYHLINERRPVTIFGEQVASKDGLAWLDLVHADLEGSGYAVGAVDLCAAGVGAPHIRQRLWFMAHPDAGGFGIDGPAASDGVQASIAHAEQRIEANRMDNAGGARLEGFAGHGDGGHKPGRLDSEPSRSTASSERACGLADTDGGDASAERQQRSGQQRQQPQNGSTLPLAIAANGQFSQSERRAQGRNGHGSNGEDNTLCTGRPGPINGHWRDADWLLCRDGKWRPVEPGTSPLVNGAPERMGRLRGYGNGIVAQAAAEFIIASKGGL